MDKGWKAAIIALAVLGLYLAVRDWQRARWLRQELYTDWIEYNRFMYDPSPGESPSDPTKPPPPPPEFWI